MVSHLVEEAELNPITCLQQYPTQMSLLVLKSQRWTLEECVGVFCGVNFWGSSQSDEVCSCLEMDVSRHLNGNRRYGNQACFEAKWEDEGNAK